MIMYCTGTRGTRYGTVDDGSRALCDRCVWRCVDSGGLKFWMWGTSILSLP